MGKTHYDVNESSRTVMQRIIGMIQAGTHLRQGAAHDNPAFTVEVQGPQEQNLSDKEMARKELDAFGEIPHGGLQDHIKFGFLIMFVVTFFVVAVVMTGTSV